MPAVQDDPDALPSVAGGDTGRAADVAAEVPNGEPEELLTPAEVAAMFRVSPKTVTRWHRSGKISAIRTLGGHRRFRANEVRRLLADGQHDRAT
jgi:excisionase family DNA binding protein